MEEVEEERKEADRGKKKKKGLLLKSTSLVGIHFSQYKANPNTERRL